MTIGFPPPPHLVYGYRWIIVKDLRHVLKAQRQELKADGEHYIGYPYVDHTAGLSMHIHLFCKVDFLGNIHSTADVRAHRLMLLVRYDTLQVSEIKVLTPQQINKLKLPAEPDHIATYRAIEVEPLRTIEYMHPLRAPGFPDDIKFILPPTAPGQRPEEVWGRLKRRVEEHVFECELLVQPFQPLGVMRGDRVLVRVRPATNGVESICIGKYKQE